MDYIIAIPSYDRAELLKTHTLTMLKNQNVKPEKINIFVANENEEKIYKTIIPSDMYNEIIVGVKGLLQQLQFIKYYYPEGTNIVRFDDDYKRVWKKKYKKTDNVSRKSMRETITIDLDEFIRYAFEITRKENLTYWGVNKLANTYFMTDGYSKDLRFINGGFNSTINSHNKKYDYIISSAENYTADDIERTIIYYIADGGVIRFNEYGFDTLPDFFKGGIQSDIGNTKRFQLIKEANKMLVKQYPEYGRIVDNKIQVELFKLIRNPKIKIKKKVIITRKQFDFLINPDLLH